MPRTADAQGFLAARGGAGLAPLAQAIGAVLREKGRCVAALDGMAAAGKTTAAALLCEAFGGACVHMDDFFLPPALRTPQRLSQPGGNVHYERFAEEVAPALHLGRALCYGVFDCSRMTLAARAACPPRRLSLWRGLTACTPFSAESFTTCAPIILFHPKCRGRAFWRATALRRFRLLRKNGSPWKTPMPRHSASARAAACSCRHSPARQTGGMYKAYAFGASFPQGKDVEPDESVL